jgi:hypothetical protein
MVSPNGRPLQSRPSMRRRTESEMARARAEDKEEPARAGLRQRKPARDGERSERAVQPSSPSRGSRSATAAAAAQTAAQRARSWHRLMLLVIAVTIHVGVGFGAVGTSESAMLQAAELLTLGMPVAAHAPHGLLAQVVLVVRTAQWHG